MNQVRVVGDNTKNFVMFSHDKIQLNAWLISTYHIKVVVIFPMNIKIFVYEKDLYFD